MNSAIVTPLFSPLWHRVAALKPRLKSHARLHRHLYRGQRWYVIQNRVSQQHHRLSIAAHTVVSLMDGERSVARLWDLAAARLGDDVPSQDEVIGLLAQLHAHDLLECDAPPEARELLERYEGRKRLKWKQRLLSPLAWRIPLVDPDRWLDRSAKLVGRLFTAWGLIAWAALVGIALVLASMHWAELRAVASVRALAMENLFLLAAVYPAVKLVHELGHAFATKVWGGEVHEMGITLLVLVPTPYVDASAASAFERKRHRIIVGAAGVMVELGLAALALLVWLIVEPGLVRDIAFNIMLIGCVSTLLFNGNPLLRFDAYYVLADAIEIPNLGHRSTRYFGYLAKRYLYGLGGARSPVSAPGERGWLFTYGALSFAYRNLILVAIVIFVSSKLFVLGAALAVWALVVQVLLPTGRYIAYLLASPELERRRFRALSVVGGALTGLLACALVVPVPDSTRAQGVIWASNQAELRGGTDAEILRLLREDGALVEANEPIVETANPLLQARLPVLEAKQRELAARHAALWPGDPVRARILEEERHTLDAQIQDLRRQVESLTIRSPRRGQLVLSQGVDLAGSYLRRGELLGYVVDPRAVSARVVVTQNQVGLVRASSGSVDAVIADHLGVSRAAAVHREVPAATDRLPSSVLAVSGGGPIPVDPQDPEQIRALQPVFQFELEFLEQPPGAFIGQRVYVRFNHDAKPLAHQMTRAIRQLLLKHFEA